MEKERAKELINEWMEEAEIEPRRPAIRKLSLQQKAVMLASRGIDTKIVGTEEQAPERHNEEEEQSGDVEE